MPVNTADLARRYREAFPDSSPLFIARAPGRVNLIGEHTDYNDGFVLPIAMSQSLYVIAGPHEDEEIIVRSTAFGETVRFSAAEPGPPAAPAWSNYVRGVAEMLRREGIPLRGGRLLVHSEIPIGGGVSSSAALEIASAIAMLALAGKSMDPIPLAHLARRAEHECAGSPCGIMDQFICVLGRENHALLLDCRSETYEHLPLPDDGTTLMVMDTQVKHQLGSSEYPVRQRQCREGLAELRQVYPGIAALRDVSSAQLDAQAGRLDPLIFRRCRHVVTEIGRTLLAAEALRDDNLSVFGRLMYESHASLRDDYGVSCMELDALVSIAADVPGVYGARMTGGGFGGCAIALVQAAAEEQLRRAIAERYNSCVEKPAILYTTRASAGADLHRL